MFYCCLAVIAVLIHWPIVTLIIPRIRFHSEKAFLFLVLGTIIFHKNSLCSLSLYAIMSGSVSTTLRSFLERHLHCWEMQQILSIVQPHICSRRLKTVQLLTINSGTYQTFKFVNVNQHPIYIYVDGLTDTKLVANEAYIFTNQISSCI